MFGSRHCDAVPKHEIGFSIFSQFVDMSLRLIRQFFWSGLLLLLAGLFNGCAGGSKNFSASSIEALPPSFLTGPVAALLTNVGPFSAHVVMSNDLRMAKNISGELFSRDGKLLFAAEPAKKNPGGAFAYITDLVSHQGFVWSEALQGYAPISLNGAAPATLTTHAEDGLTRVNNHPCQVEQTTVQMSDGSASSFRVFRALDLNRLPVQIRPISNTPPFGLSFSKVRSAPPPVDLFTPPGGFTKYDSPEMMVTELIMRQHNLTRRPAAAPEPLYDYKSRR